MHFKEKIWKLNKCLRLQNRFLFSWLQACNKVDECGLSDRNIDDETKRQKTGDENGFNIFNAINEIHRRIKKSSKEYLTDIILKRLELKFE